MGSESVKNWVANLYDDYKAQYSIVPTFEDIIKDCIYLKGLDTAEYLFNTLKQGWLENNYPEMDFNKLYKNTFCDTRNYYYSEMKNLIENNSDSELEANYRQINREEVDEYNNNLLKSINPKKE